MFAKTLIAAAALTAVTAGMASTAEAKIKFHGDIHIGGYFPVYDAGYYDDYYAGDECFYKKVKKVKWHNHGGFMHKHVIFKKKLVCY